MNVGLPRTRPEKAATSQAAGTKPHAEAKPQPGQMKGDKLDFSPRLRLLMGSISGVSKGAAAETRARIEEHGADVTTGDDAVGPQVTVGLDLVRSSLDRNRLVFAAGTELSAGLMHNAVRQQYDDHVFRATTTDKIGKLGVNASLVSNIGDFSLRADALGGVIGTSYYNAAYIGGRASLSYEGVGIYYQVDQDINGPQKGLKRIGMGVAVEF